MLQFINRNFRSERRASPHSQSNLLAFYCRLSVCREQQHERGASGEELLLLKVDIKWEINTLILWSLVPQVFKSILCKIVGLLVFPIVKHPINVYGQWVRYCRTRRQKSRQNPLNGELLVSSWNTTVECIFRMPFCSVFHKLCRKEDITPWADMLRLVSETRWWRMPLNPLHHQFCVTYWLFTPCYDTQDIGLHRRIFIREQGESRTFLGKEVKGCAEGGKEFIHISY